MKNRIKNLRKALGIKQSDFASALTISQGHLSDVENGRKEVSDRIINICSLRFNVNEEWLRTGDGEMFNELSKTEKLSEFFNTGNKEEKELLLNNLSELTEDNLELVESIVNSILNHQKKLNRSPADT